MYVARGQLTCDPLTHASPFRILVGHHPPSWWRFRENRENLVRSRFHLQLFGHEHNFAPENAINSVRVTAGAINPEDAPAGNARYNWILISDEGDSYLVRIWSRVYDGASDKFAEDPEWPAGQGFRISRLLDAAPVVVPPETDAVGPIQSPDVAVANRDVEEPVAGEAEQPEARPPISAESIRYALFAESHEVYSTIFESIGFVPNDLERETLGGLEYYEDAFESILGSGDLPRLVTAMETAGVNVHGG